MRILIALSILLSTSVETMAGGLEIVPGPVGPSPQAGTTVTLPLYYHNTGTVPIDVTLEPLLDCRLVTQEGSIDVVAHRTGTASASVHRIAGSGFVKALYSILLPATISGHVHLEIPALPAGTVYFPVARAPDKTEERFAWVPRTAEQPLEALIQLYQPYLKNISFYEPMYFLAGTEPQNSTFQISLKYSFFNENKQIVKNHPWLLGFHFGYTQTSFWDLGSDSAPFEDTSYKPELFFVSQRLKSDLPLLDGMFFKTGVRHESNGRGGDMSRSTNTAYIEPILVFYNPRSQVGLKIAPRASAYFRNEDENNADLDRYRGHLGLGFTVGKADSWVMDTQLGFAAEGASVQVDLSYPLHNIKFNPLDIYIQAQYVNRLAESLLNYKERSEAFRLGIAIVR